MKRGPFIPNIEPIIAAGIDPKTGLPIKMTTGSKCDTKINFKRLLRIIDEQDAVNRYVWHNLPCNISSLELERLIYYKGQLCFFYNKEDEKFYFMPYTLSSTIDFYGRFNNVRPIPLNGSGQLDTSKADDYLSKKMLKVQYGIVTEEITVKDLENSCVLLNDYSKQSSQEILPRAIVNDVILDSMADCPAYMRTALISGTGVKGVRVNDADQAASVKDGSRSLDNAALTGAPWVPLVGAIEFQELTDGAVAKAEEFMLAMQSLDNLRLSTYGINNGGLFEKKAHELNAEARINGAPVGLVLQDGLTIRQNFCNIVNSIWGLGIWCEVAENIAMTDFNGDGCLQDRDTKGTMTGVEPKQGGNQDAKSIE